MKPSRMPSKEKVDFLSTENISGGTNVPAYVKIHGKMIQQYGKVWIHFQLLYYIFIWFLWLKINEIQEKYHENKKISVLFLAIQETKCVSKANWVKQNYIVLLKLHNFLLLFREICFLFDRVFNDCCVDSLLQYWRSYCAILQKWLAKHETLGN